MDIHLQQHQGSQLICYFSGWGTPPSAVKHLRLPPNTDLAIAYRYHNLAYLIDLDAYENIHIVAWSMGVWVAEQVFQPLFNADNSLLSRIKSATAVNGTGLPRHNTKGIPTAIFDATVKTLNPQSRLRFERRMCGEFLSQYQQVADYRDFEDIQQELQCLQHWLSPDSITPSISLGITSTPESHLPHVAMPIIPWSHALLATQDAIFPIKNMRRYWQPYCPIHEVKGEHWLFPTFTHWEELWNI